MDDLNKRIEYAREHIEDIMKDPAWLKNLEESDKRLKEDIERRKRESIVSWEDLNEPTTI